MADDVVWEVVFGGQLYYKFLKDLGVSIWWRPVLSTLYLRGEESTGPLSLHHTSMHPSLHPPFYSPCSPLHSVKPWRWWRSAAPRSSSRSYSQSPPLGLPHMQQPLGYTQTQSHAQEPAHVMNMKTLPWAAMYFLDSLNPCDEKTSDAHVKNRSWPPSLHNPECSWWRVDSTECLNVCLCLMYVYKAGVDVVTACAAIPSGQLDTIIIIWIKRKRENQPCDPICERGGWINKPKQLSDISTW